MLTARHLQPEPQSPFCLFFKKQAVLDHIPNNIFGHRCANFYLTNNNLLETPVGMHEYRVRDSVHLPDTIYYTLRLHGDRGNHPKQDTIDDVQKEIEGIFQRAGIAPMPVACHATWKADDWERNELMRFDETMQAGHGQDARCAQQKYERTNGDVVLSYPFPKERIDEVCKAMAAVEDYRAQHCSVTK